MSKVLSRFAAAAVSALLFAGAGANAAEIDYGPYCGAACRAALTPQKPLDSYHGKVAFAVASLTFAYGAALKSRTEQAAKLFPNIQFTVGDGQNDPSVQSGLIDNYISQGIQVLIINAVEKDALAPAIRRAEKAGIKVIEIDRTVSAPVLVTIKANDYDLGFNAGMNLIHVLDGKGNVVEIQGSPAASPTLDRHRGFMDALKTAPGIKIIASEHGNYDQAAALQVMEDMLQRFPGNKITAVFTHADMMTFGAMQAIRASGRQGTIKVFSIDGQQMAFDRIAKGTLDATAVYPVVAPMDMIAAAKALDNEPMPSFIKLEAPVVTKANVATFNGTTY